MKRDMTTETEEIQKSLGLISKAFTTKLENLNEMDEFLDR